MIRTRNFISFLLLSSATARRTAAATTSQQYLRQIDACTGTPTQETGEVLITASGDPGTLNPADVAALEASYMQTLQEMEPEPCFEVLEVEINLNIERRRHLLTNEYQRRRLSSGFQFVLWFSYKCFSCPSTIFGNDNDASRRTLLNLGLPTTEESSLNFDFLIPEESTKISRSAFNSAFQSNFQSDYPELQEKIPEIIALSELQVLNECSAPSYDQAKLVVTFQGDHSPMENGSTNQIYALESAIKKAYSSMNSPNPHSSDIHTRTLSEVVFSFSQDFGTEFDIYFSVWYEFRNGSTNGRIFDDLIDSGDYDRTELIVSKGSSLIQEECLYDIAAQYLRAPTPTEFISAFNLVLLESGEQLNFVTAVVAASAKELI